jgi:hypothetical protein
MLFTERIAMLLEETAGKVFRRGGDALIVDRAGAGAALSNL